MGYFYRGRHRAPTPTTARLAAVAATGAVSLPLLGGVAAAAPAGNLGVIAACESSGNPHASNGSHFGLFQFDLPTWRSVGGTGNPADASVSEQVARAGMLFAARGTQPWLASQGCWNGAHPPAPVDFAALGAPAPARPAVHAAAPAHHAAPAAPHAAPQPSWAAAAARGHYTVKAGDTLSRISPAHWRQVWTDNHATIGDNPNLIFPGQQLAL